MESAKAMNVTLGKGILRRAFAKVLNIHKLSGVAPEDGVEKLKKSRENNKFNQDFAKNSNLSQSFDKLEEEDEERWALEALLAKLFATISSIKSAYAQLQHAQSPYDSGMIQKADNLIVSELKTLSELKQCFLKKDFDPCPGKTLVLAEIQELNSLLKTYEIMGKNLEAQMKIKDSEAMLLKDKLEGSVKQIKLMEKKLNQSGQFYGVSDNIHLSGINPTHFATYLHYTVRSIRGFVRLMVDEMNIAGWDIGLAAKSIQPDVLYYKTDHKCFAFEYFVCKVMFEAFDFAFFLDSGKSPEKKQSGERRLFFEKFNEVKSMKPKEYLSAHPKSRFARFCRAKYLQLVHPKMEEELFGHTHLRNQVNAGEFPETAFASAFLEMAKRIWLLHCFSRSFEEKASIFQIPRGCRFSEVYMKSVSEEAFTSPESESEPRVAFTVVPGFKVCKTFIQCEVYLSNSVKILKGPRAAAETFRR